MGPGAAGGPGGSFADTVAATPPSSLLGTEDDAASPPFPAGPCMHTKPVPAAPTSRVHALPAGTRLGSSATTRPKPRSNSDSDRPSPWFPCPLTRHSQPRYTPPWRASTAGEPERSRPRPPGAGAGAAAEARLIAHGEDDDTQQKRPWLGIYTRTRASGSSARLGAALSPRRSTRRPDAMMEGPRQFAMGAARVGQEAAADSRSGWVHDFARGQRGVAGAGLAGAGPTSSSWADDFARMSLNGDGARGGMQQTRQAPPKMAQGQQQRHHHQRPQEWAEEYSGVKESSGAAHRHRPEGWGEPGNLSRGEGGPARLAQNGLRSIIGSSPAASGRASSHWEWRRRRGKQGRNGLGLRFGRRGGTFRSTTLGAAAADPKFQKSQFLQFMSRMSREKSWWRVTA